MYLLDTNVCIRLLNGTAPNLGDRFASKRPSEIRLCSVVKAELVYGARKSARPAENLRRLERFFAALSSVPFDDECAADYGALRADLERVGRPIGPHDLMIAAIACHHAMILVTHNVAEFSRVAGLQTEDWEA